ncbi:DMT family transporter [Caldibacillus debilis]|uniref:DMT family transporter n=1 Tax=Caldibacillus debilis TaxID=301148 RepID=UPI0030B8EBA6
MMKFFLPFLALLGGAAIAVQSQVNGELGKKTGVIEASLINFAVGTLVLLMVVIFFGRGELSAAAAVPKWQLTGGILGAFYVLMVVFSVPRIGVTATLMSAIAGQMLLGAVIDHFGFFGGERDPMNGTKILALILLLFSLILFHSNHGSK